MPFSLVPNQLCRSIYTLDLARLQQRGIRLLLADLDNTLARYSERQPSAQLLAWTAQVKSHGITLFVLSNSRKATRADEFCHAMDIPYLKHAGKPKKTGFAKALEINGVSAAETAIIGDQIFTDILGGNRSDIHTILVHPLAIDNAFRAFRYGIETPFRMCSPDKREWKND